MVPFVSAQGKLKLTMSGISLQSPNYETASHKYQVPKLPFPLTLSNLSPTKNEGRPVHNSGITLHISFI